MIRGLLEEVKRGLLVALIDRYQWGHVVAAFSGVSHSEEKGQNVPERNSR